MKNKLLASKILIFAVAFNTAVSYSYASGMACHELFNVNVTASKLVPASNLKPSEDPLQSPILQQLRSFANGAMPDFNNPQQMALFQLYRLKYFGDPTTQIKSDTVQLVIAALKANAGVRKERFNSIKVDLRTALKLSEETNKFMQQAKQSAQIANGKIYNISANSGFWNKIFETVPQKVAGKKGLFSGITDAISNSVSSLAGNRYKQYFSEEFVTKMESDTVSADQKAKILFARLLEIRADAVTAKGADFVGIRNLSQVMVDLVHSQPFLNKELSNLLKSNNGIVAIETFDKLLAGRDLFAVQNGFSSFEQMLTSFGLKQPSSLPLPNQKFIEQWNKQKSAVVSTWDKNLNENNFSIRQMSEAESIYRSCVGGNECSSRTYPTRALDPNYHYFTMTDLEGHSTGSITVVLGKGMVAGHEVKVAFLDKMQNVSADRISVFIEGARQSLIEQGYQLVAPKDLGLNEGLTNSKEVRAFLTAYMAQGQVLDVIGFTPNPHQYQFENKFSRAGNKLPSFVIGALPGDHFALSILAATPFHPVTTPDLQVAATASYNLKSGNDKSKILYIKTQEALKDLNLADPDYQTTVEQWADSAEISFAVKKQVLLASDPAVMLDLAEKKLNEGEKLRFFTAVVSSPFYRKIIGTDRVYAFLEKHPEYIKQLSTENLAGFSLAKLVKMNSQTLLAAAVGKSSLEKINKKNSETGNTAVNTAAGNGNLSIVKSLREHGADLTLPNLEGRTPLIRSLINKHHDVADYIVDQLTQPELDHTDGSQHSALYYSIRYQNLTVLQKLLTKNASVHFVNIYGQVESTALIEAVKLGQANLVQVILASHPELANEPDLKGANPLKYAQKKGFQEIMQILESAQ